MANKKTKYIDHLEEDDPITGQKWVCISFLSPEGIKNCSTRGLKIRGVYDTKEEADERAEELSALDPDFHVFVGEVGKWLPWDPDPNSIKDQKYQNKQLQGIMKGYKDNLKKAKKMQRQRKDEMIKTAAHNELKKNDIKERLRKKLEKKKALKKAQNIASINNNISDDKKGGKRKKNKKKNKLDEKLKEIDFMNEQAKKEKERINEQTKELDETHNNIDKLSKIHSLYKKYKQNLDKAN